jgi:hypothetical protein
MTPTDLRAAAIELHGSLSAAAAAWQVPLRTLMAWVRGEYRIPGHVETLVRYDRERRERRR